MVKTILLRCNDEFFYKMKDDKVNRECKLGTSLKWEEYVEILFGFRRGK